MNNKYINNLILGDALQILEKLEENSIDLVLTDPPYFLDKLDNNWDHKNVSAKKNQQVIKSLPAGMKFDKNQGIEFYNWYIKISQALIKVLKPGGYFFSFSSPRLYHRMASAIDDAGFLIKDCFLWLYTQNQAKAMSLNHFIDKMDVSEKKKKEIKKQLDGWKTPQIKSCFEPIIMAQKQSNGTLLNNMLTYEVGLVNTKVKIGENMFPANVLTIDNMNEYLDKYFLISKPNKKEKGDYNNHKTVKPLELCEHIIKLTAFSKNAVVLDPFLGSGTTAVAAKKLGVNYIGIDTNYEYIEIAKKRLAEIRPTYRNERDKFTKSQIKQPKLI
ncbi:MAG TPA: site-specific DNA-methyltransferase [bacterium]|nr:site-specific DNA-methyltransferase [bacterium]